MVQSGLALHVIQVGQWVRSDQLAPVVPVHLSHPAALALHLDRAILAVQCCQLVL